jgi:phosphoribosylanthranilate isomerase
MSSSSTCPIPGSGKVFDWRLAEGAPRGKRLLLAGGLHAENVGEAIRLVRPWGVDVATGVEESPGHKDPRKLRAFIATARDAATDIADRTIDLASAESEVAGVTRPWDWETD